MCGCGGLVVSWLNGTLGIVLREAPAASFIPAKYAGDAAFAATTAALFVFVLGLYWSVWSAFTLSFDRRLHVLPAVAMG